MAAAAAALAFEDRASASRIARPGYTSLLGSHGTKIRDDGTGLKIGQSMRGHGGAGDAFLNDGGHAVIGGGAAESPMHQVDAGNAIAIGPMTGSASVAV